MLFTLDKLKHRVNELKTRRYCGHTSIAPLTAMEGELSKDEWYKQVPESIQGSDYHLGDTLEGRDNYLWLAKTVQIPAAKEGFEVVGLFDFGITGGGYNSGFESLLYVNKHPFQGVDTNHQEVFFEGYEEQTLDLAFLLWSGLKDRFDHSILRHVCTQADFAYLHKKADELYYFGHAITETLDFLEQRSEYYEPLMGALDRAFRQLHWEEDEEFYASVDVAHQVLMESLSKMEKHTDITLHAVGHTHIDVAWLWRLKHTREKAQRSFSTVLRLMERYDEYVFLQTQPQLYQFIQQDCPELYEKIKEKVAQGKWEPDGGMWVEADCNITSGEALVRQFLHGTRFFQREFGKKCEYLWLPDVFGYSWALPQILKLCEIDTFMTTKISWNQYNTIPNDLFRWRGIDGTEILTYFVDVPPNGRMAGGRFSTYNGMMNPGSVIGSWLQFKNKELTHHNLISYGYGDGGGGVTRDMLEMRRVMDKLPGIPHVKPGKAGDFFKKIHEDVANTDRYVHTWDGELYLEYHRGTYTTQGYNKRTNRQLEIKLAQLEWLSSLAYVLGGEYAQQQLHDSWECVLLHQFHDIIPGSSIHEVYEDSHVNYGRAQETMAEVERQVLDHLQKPKPDAYTVYSSNSFRGEELVFIPETRAGRFLDADGRVLSSQKREGGYDVRVTTEPFAGVVIHFQEAAAKEAVPSFTLTGRTLETPHYTIQWNEQGRLTNLFDKDASRRVFRQGEIGHGLEIYEDKPMNYDAWDIDIYYKDKVEYPELAAEPVLVECGELKAVVRFEFRYRNSAFMQDMVCYRDSRRIDFVTHADWHENHKLLKAVIHTDLRSTKATYDIQFGHVERPTHWNTSWDWARFEVCGHKWADLSESNYGLSLLNNCKYGHSVKDNVMTLSLLRSPKSPDESADMGEHDFTYSLYPHENSITLGGTIEEANRLNLPALVVPGEMTAGHHILSVSGDSLIIDVVKKAEDEDCLVVRMHECRGGRTVATVTSDLPVKRIVPCNLLEHDLGDAMEGREVTAEFGPFEIKTYKFYL